MLRVHSNISSKKVNIINKYDNNIIKIVNAYESFPIQNQLLQVDISQISPYGMNIFKMAGDKKGETKNSQKSSKESKTLTQIKMTIKRLGKPKDILEFDISGILVGKFTPEIKKVLEEMVNLEVLIIAECDITSLENFPTFKKIKQLDISSNSIKDTELNTIITTCKSLIKLNIADNKIQKLESIAILKGLKTLECLDAADNLIESDQKYFKYIFDTLKSLKVLDNKDKDGKEVMDYEVQEEEEGSGEDEQIQEGQQKEGADGQGQQSEQGEGQEDDDEEFDGEEQSEQDQEDVPQPKKKKK